MLIQFTVENYRSFRDRTVFSMRKASNVERGGDAPDVVRDTDILRCAAMYGANASGKSNFIKALSFARDLVVAGVSERGRIRTLPFRLDGAAAGSPSRFEFYIRAATGRSYGYGFVVRSDAVLQEWLSEVVHGEEVEIFSRDSNSFRFASQREDTTGELLSLVGSATRANQLFLRTTREFKSERFPSAFADVLSWFAETLIIIEPGTTYDTLIPEADSDESFRAFLGDVLRRADTGISGVHTIRRVAKKSERDYLKHFGSDGPFEEDGRRIHFVAEGNKWYRVELRLKHAGRASNDESEFELQDESDGTVRLLDLSPMLFHKKKQSQVFVVDELDRSVHTALTRWLVERFISEGAGTDSQLIFTTHDTNLLDVQQLRPDAIWFAEKDERGASTLYSLAEFKKEQLEHLTGALEQGYLNGRFGAIPFLAGPIRLAKPQEDE